MKTSNYFRIIFLVMAAMVLSGCQHIPNARESQFSDFKSLKNFSSFTTSRNENGDIVVLSPKINSRIKWNELIVSWNAEAPAGTFLKIEAAAGSGNHISKFYTIANWSADGKIFPRTSVPKQRDSDGTVDTDTLIVTRPADAAQIRLTLGGQSGMKPKMKFLGLSFANTKILPAAREPNRAAWNHSIATPEHSQHGAWTNKGWCSPTSLSMVLSRWAAAKHRPEMNLSVPEVAAGVYDADFGGTGNWPFNTAFAGSFPGMRAYVTRFDDIAEVEDWLEVGIPVILSARWDWLLPGRPIDTDGHLIVCTGFTKDGDVMINDPATRLEKGESVRRIYKRADVIRAWTKSHNAVYLVYPVGTKIPPNRYGHWEN